MPTVTSRTFRAGNSEAVRLPREVAFGADMPVTVTRSGDVITITPVRPPLALLVERLAQLPGPTGVERRDEASLGERDGL